MKTNALVLAFVIILIAAGCKTENPTAVVKPKILGLHEITDTTYINIPQCLQWPYYYFEWGPDSLDTLVKSSVAETSDSCYQLNYFINDTESYKSVYSVYYGGPCNLPIIDFSSYSLLGSYNSADGANKGYITRKIYIDDSTRTCTYDITFYLTETVKTWQHNSMNWVLIPKIPSDYKIIFKTIRIRLQ